MNSRNQEQGVRATSRPGPLVAAVALGGSVLLGNATIAYAQACKGLAGTWTGTFTRGTPEALTIVIGSDCSAAWSGPFTNSCTLSEVTSGSAKYSCSKGSQGTITISANRLTWKNTFTGDNYVVRVKR